MLENVGEPVNTTTSTCARDESVLGKRLMIISAHAACKLHALD